MIGKQIRIERIINRVSGRSIVVPMDHGVTVGPIAGLVNVRETIGEVVAGGANAILMHKGIVSAGHRGQGKDVGLIVHLSASTAISPDSNAKVIVCSVEEAIILGADAVSVHVNLGARTDTEMLRAVGEVGRDCQKWGMPMLVMMYARGDNVENEYDVKHIKLAARVAAELGADMVKVNYTGTPDSFSEVVAGCPVPVLIAGGEKMDSDRALLEMVDGALRAGAAGISIGRNVFQHKNVRLMVKALSALIHKKKDLDAALQMLAGVAV